MNSRTSGSIAEDVDSLAELIDAMDEKDVRAFLLQAIRNDSALECKLRSRYGTLDVAGSRQMLKHALADTVDEYSRHGYINYYDAIDFETRYSAIARDALKPFISKGHAEGVFALVEVITESLREVEVDDSDGFSSDVLALCVDAWRRAFGMLNDAEVVNRHIASLFAYAESVLDEPDRGGFVEFIVDEIDKMLIDLFADDLAHAQMILELADRRIEDARAAFEWRCREAQRRSETSRWHSSQERPEPKDYESPRWAVVRVRAMRALGMESDDILAFARPFATNADMLMVLFDMLDDAGREHDAFALLEQALDCGGMDRFSRRRVGLFLKDAYREHDDVERLRNMLEQLIETSSDYERGAGPVSLLGELKAVVPADSWVSERDALLARMESPDARCDCLAAEGLSDRLLAELASGSVRHRTPASYEDVLLAEHADVLVRWYGDEARREMNGARDRKGYRMAAETLAHLAGLPDGAPPAAELALEWREAYHRRTAMLDELKKAGF